MTDTNQLPPSEREAFEAFAQNCPMGKYSIARRGDGYDSSHTQLMWDAWQARAQVQGEPFGYIHHFAAHDESGVLIDTTWEADGCADPLPHPTFPSMWKWAQSTPFYTAPQATPVCGAQNAESDPQAPLSLTAAPQQATPDDMKVYDSIADRYFREAPQAEVTDDIRSEDFTVDVVVKSMGGFAPVNTQGVRVTHKPTGISVTCDAARSQHTNRHQAFEKLSAILATPTAQAHPAEVTEEKILEIAEPFGEFQYGDAQGDKRIDFARAILALRHERGPMTGDERGEAYLKQSRSSEGPRSTFMRGVFAAEAHHGITTKTKKETP